MTLGSPDGLAFAAMAQHYCARLEDVRRLLFKSHMTFLLIRHATTDHVGRRLSGRAPGLHLNDRGHQEARLLAQRLESVPLAAIYASPLERARQTAQPIARMRSLSIRYQDDLTDVDYGEWTGRELDSLRDDPRWQRFNAVRSCARAPGGEAMLDIQARVINALTDFQGVHRGEAVAIVTHADVIRAAIAYYAGIPLDLCQRLEISPASISVVQVGGDQPSILTINDNSVQIINASMH